MFGLTGTAQRTFWTETEIVHDDARWNPNHCCFDDGPGTLGPIWI